MKKIKNRSLRLESLEDRMLLAVTAGSESVATELIAPAETGAQVVVQELTQTALQNAINDASNGDTIVFAQGGTITISSAINISKNVTIDGGGEVTIAAAGTRLFNFNASACTLSGLDLTRGSTTSDNGGVGLVDNGRSVVIENCSIYGNSSSGAGGAFYVYGQLFMNNCNVYGNTGDYGGFAFINGQSNNGAATIDATNCNFYSNSATGYGAVIGNQGGTLYLTNCSVVGNASPQGAITNYNFFICTENSGSEEDPDNPGSYNHKYFISDTTLTNTIIAYNYSPDSATADIYDLYGFSMWGQGAKDYPILLKEDIYTKIRTENSIIGLTGDYFVEAPILDDAGNLLNADTINLTVKSDGLAAYAGIGANPGAYTGPGYTADSLVVTTLDDIVADDGQVSLREALSYAALGNFSEIPTVTFADELAGGVIKLTQGVLPITFDVNIVADDITLDALQADRALYLKSYNYQMNMEGNYHNYESVAACPMHNYDPQYMINVSIGGLNFENGAITLSSSATGGAGIYLFQNARLNLKNSHVSDNVLTVNSAYSQANSGGGGIAALYYSEISLDHVDVVDNTVIQTGEHETGVVLQGGGIYVGHRSILNVYDSTISRNRLTSEVYLNNNAEWGYGYGYGAGICSNGDMTQITYSTVSDNTIRGCAIYQQGAGVYNTVAQNPRSASYGMILANTAITGNSMGDHNTENNAFCKGGGVFNTGEALLVNDLIAENSFDAGNESVNMTGYINGAGVYNEAAMDIYYCTITNNVAACIDYETFSTDSNSWGGGFYNTGDDAAPNFVGCILIDNYVQNSTTGDKTANDMYKTDKSTFVLSNTLYRMGGVKGTGYQYIDCIRWANRYTLFVDAENSDYRLASDSVVIDKLSADAETSPIVYEYDLRNLPYVRVYNEVQDFGCYEYQPEPEPVPQLELELTDYAGTYDAESHTISISGLEEGDVVTYSADGINYSESVVSYSSAGTRYVYVKASRAGYQDFSGSAKVTISAKALTVSGTTVADKVYDGTTAADVTLGAVSGIVAGDDAAVVPYAEFPSAEVGDYDVTVTYTVSGTAASNYIAPSSDVVSASISEKGGGEQLAAPSITTGSRGIYVSYGANRHLIQWGAVSNASGYEIGYKADGADWMTATVTDSEAVIEGLTYGSDVTYRVRALGDGVSYTDSDWSTVKTFNVCPMDINNDDDISGADRNLLANSWLSEEGDEEYQYYADINGDGDVSGADRNYLSGNWLAESGDEDLTYPRPVRADAVFAAYESGDLDVDFDVF